MKKEKKGVNMCRKEYSLGELWHVVSPVDVLLSGRHGHAQQEAGTIRVESLPQLLQRERTFNDCSTQGRDKKSHTRLYAISTGLSRISVLPALSFDLSHRP